MPQKEKANPKEKKHKYINLNLELYERLDAIRQEKSDSLGFELSWSDFLSWMEQEHRNTHPKASGGPVSSGKKS